MKQCMNFKFVILFALTLLVGSTVYGQDNVIDEVVWVVGCLLYTSPSPRDCS